MKREWVAVIAIVLTLGRGAVREVEKTAAREIQQRIGGKVSVRIELDGARGLTEWKIRKLTVNAESFTLDGFPFTLETERPKSGHIRRFVMHLRDANLHGLRAESAWAEIPDIYYDRQLALRRRIFRLSATGIGPAEIVVHQAELANYIRRKYAPYIREATVEISPTRTQIEGMMVLLSGTVRFRAVGVLQPREGRYLDLASAQIEIEGTALPPETVEQLRRWLNPIIDVERDLGIYDGLQVDSVLSETERMRALGKAWIPAARPSTGR